MRGREFQSFLKVKQRVDPSERLVMPKLKTKKTASKRFKMTRPRGGKKWKILYKKSKEGHLRTKRTSRRKSRVRKSHTVSEADHERISKMITS